MAPPPDQTPARPPLGEGAIARAYHADAAERYADVVVVLHDADAVPRRHVELELVFVFQPDAIPAHDAIERQLLHTEIERRKVEVLAS